MSRFPDEIEPLFPDSSEPTLADYKPYSVAWIIQRVIEDIAANPEMKQIGVSQMYALRRLQREPIGKKDARRVGKSDIIEHVKWRRSGGSSGKKVGRATASGDLTAIRGVFAYASATWEKDCGEISVAQIIDALPYLKKHDLVGKANVRTQRPTDEQIHALLDHFAKQNRNPRTKIDMVQVTMFGLASSRRISETCRITWGDIDFENKIYWVRDLKHPTKKKGNDKSFILFPPIEAVIRLQPRLTDNPAERVFPYNDHTCSQRYTDAKRALSIVNLRMHDNRGDCISRYLLKMSAEDVRLVLSGHDNTKILEDVYDRRDPLEILKAKHSHLLEKPEEPRP